MARKSRNHRLDLPPLELECMKVLWALGEGTVHTVHSQIFAARPLAYTTIMTIMVRLARKGVVERQKRGRAHFYRPLVAATAVRICSFAYLLLTLVGFHAISPANAQSPAFEARTGREPITPIPVPRAQDPRRVLLGDS